MVPVKVGIYYSSMTGNTARLAASIEKALAGRCETKLADIQDCASAGEELIFAGFWVDKGVCTAKMLDFLGGLQGKRVALFGTAGTPDQDGYYHGILGRVAAMLPEGNEYLGGFLCQGEMPASIRERYEALLQREPDQPAARRMIAVYQSAVGHPDFDDLERAAVFAREICDKTADGQP